MMSLTPQALLSPSARERCVANFQQLKPIVVHNDFSPTSYASVLVPLCVVDDEVSLLYTLRSTHLKAHSGQVSFPGGKIDGNETVVETALRETEEEIGIPPQDVDIWGEMKPVQARSKADILITPVVGEIRNFDMKKLEPNFHEVEEIFTVPISVLCNPDNHGYFHHDELPPLPLFLYDKHIIWGSTGLITDVFLQYFLGSCVYKPKFMRRKFEVNELIHAK